MTRLKWIYSQVFLDKNSSALAPYPRYHFSFFTVILFFVNVFGDGIILVISFIISISLNETKTTTKTNYWILKTGKTRTLGSRKRMRYRSIVKLIILFSLTSRNTLMITNTTMRRAMMAVSSRLTLPPNSTQPQKSAPAAQLRPLLLLLPWDPLWAAQYLSRVAL